MTEPNRLKRWEKACRIFWGVEDWLTILGNQLGRLDVELIDEEVSLVKNARPIPGGGRQIEFGRQLIFAYLWVLGAYEFVRVLNQRQKENTAFFCERLPNSRLLKQRFERIRIPLAKLEPAKKHRKTDFSIAFPLIDPKRQSIGWSVAPGVMITRRELSDELLAFLEQVSPSGSHQ